MIALRPIHGRRKACIHFLLARVVGCERSFAGTAMQKIVEPPIIQNQQRHLGTGVAVAHPAIFRKDR